MHSLSFNHPCYMFNDTFERSSLLVSSPLSVVNVNDIQSCHEHGVGEVRRRQSYYLYSRVERLLPESLNTKCSYSCCYAANISLTNRLGVINHRVLCKGFNQPTLIKWSICKRLDFYGGIRESCGGMIYGVSTFPNIEKVCAFEDRRKKGKKGLGYNRKRQFLSNVSDDCVDNVEIMLGLLNGETGFDFSDVTDRGYIKKGKKNVSSGIVERDLKCDEGVKSRSLVKSENLELRKEGSSRELEGVKDFEVKCEGYVGQTSSNECKNDWERRHHEGCVDEVVGNIEQQEIVKEEKEFLEKDNVKGSYGEPVGASRDWRKKSEKKLNEEFKQHESTIYVNIDPCNSNVVDNISDAMGSKMKYKRLEKDKSVIDSTFIREKKLKTISEVSKPQEIDMRGNSSFSESRMKNIKDKTTEVSDQTEDSREEKHQKLGSREKSQQIFGISDTDFDYCERSLNSHRNSDIQMKKQKWYPESLSSEAMFTNAERDAANVNTISIEDNDLSSDIKLVKESGNEGSGSGHRKGGGSSHLSQGSGPKGPSDEMWHVTDASTQDPSESDAPDTISYISENGEPVKTSGRSLWTVIGDVVRLHWKSPRSGSHTPNSGGAKGSSYLSTGSDTWFSSHEPDDSNDENVKRRGIKGLDSPLTSSNTNSGPYRSSSLSIIKESCFPPSTMQMERSPGITETLEADETHKYGNDSKNGEIKRRKLGHKDQASKDNFDEWEKAYTFQAKQRKSDEMFMKEALLEAKKAADVWEVPVGAVLVKGGKIIARGYNLVEELHDSTAHAEMICIRKASTNLQSWKLTDTTLYVTLEPCPMCAGAILQARIDTVVWGAPNKLLGADGSWIRLFCDEDTGSGSMSTDKPPAPPHPFHPNMSVRRGVLAAECAEVMQQFFRLRRKKKTEPKLGPEAPTPPSTVTVSHPRDRHHSNFFSKVVNIPEKMMLVSFLKPQASPFFIQREYRDVSLLVVGIS